MTSGPPSARSASGGATFLRTKRKLVRYAARREALAAGYKPELIDTFDQTLLQFVEPGADEHRVGALNVSVNGDVEPTAGDHALNHGLVVGVVDEVKQREVLLAARFATLVGKRDPYAGANQRGYCVPVSTLARAPESFDRVDAQCSVTKTILPSLPPKAKLS